MGHLWRYEMTEPLPVVFIHGLRLSGACWQQQKQLLTSRVVVAPDLPGHGSRRGEPFTLHASVAAVTQAIDAVGGRAVLVGHSLGGFVAIATAAQHPEKVAALVGADCSLVPGFGLRIAFRMSSCFFSATPGIGDAVTTNLLRRLLPGDVAEPVIAAGIAHEVVPSVMSAAASLDPLRLLRSYPGRVLLLNGGHDHFRCGERRFLASTHSGDLQVVPGAGHYLPLTHSAVCARIIDDAAYLAAHRGNEFLGPS